MYNKFVGRQKETKIFKKLLRSESPEFLAVYGRRRVGKTFLIRKYFSSKLIFEFSGAFEAELDIQLDNFFNQYLKWTQGRRETSPPNSWTKAFQYLADFLYSLKHRKRKIVVFIDELPWLDTPRSGFVSALEYFWNQHGSQLNNLLFIACGSSASWMKNKLIKAKGGLYNRVTKRMKLHAFTLAETEEYCNRYNLEFTRYQLIQLYMVMGGIPFYLKELHQGKSIAQLIDEICFSPNGLLSDEYDQLYESLYKNHEDHVAIVEALASKPNGLLRNDLVKYSGLPDGGTFTRTIQELLDSDFISKTVPFAKKKKDTIYRLTDYYTLFYLKFIAGNVTNRKNTWQQIENQNSYRAWSGYAFENICLQHNEEIHRALGIDGIKTNVQSWKRKADDDDEGAQIDMLIDRADNLINLCEIKFYNSEYLLTKKYADELRKKKAIFQRTAKTKKAVHVTLVTTYPAIQNKYYKEYIHSSVSMDDLFESK